MRSRQRALAHLLAIGLVSLLAAPLLAAPLHGVFAAATAALAPDGLSLWPDTRVQAMMVRGVALSLCSAVLATAVGGLVGVAMMLPSRGGWRLGLLSLLAAAFCCGTVVHLLAWRTPFPGVAGGPGGWLLAVTALGARYAPLAAALFVVGLAALDRAELESALCLGGWRAAWAIARGRLLRIAGISVAAVGALVFGEAELPPLVGVSVYAEEFLSLVALEPSVGAAAAQGWPLMAAAMVCGGIVASLPRFRPAAAGEYIGGWVGAWVHAPRAVRLFAPSLALLVAGLPLGLLAAGTIAATGRWQAVAGPALMQSLGNSLGVAACASMLACLWAWALAAAAFRAGPWAASTLHVAVAMVILWPSSLTGLAVLALSSGAWSPFASADLAPLVAAHALRILPFAAWVMLSIREAEPIAGREQLVVLGASAWGRLRYVHGPAAGRPLLATFVLGLGLSLAELTATVLTVPPGLETVILRLYNLLHYGDQRGVMTLALCQGLAVAALCAAAVAGGQFLTRRRDAGS